MSGQQAIEDWKVNAPNTPAEIYARIRADVIEECAKVCDAREKFAQDCFEKVYGHGQAHCARLCANEIRALKRRGPE